MTLAYDEVWVREPRLMVPRQEPIRQVKIDYSSPFSQKLNSVLTGTSLVELTSRKMVSVIGSDISRSLAGYKWTDTPTNNSYINVGKSSVDLIGKYNTFLVVGQFSSMTRDHAVFSTTAPGSGGALFFSIKSDGSIILRKDGAQTMLTTTGGIVSVNNLFCVAITTKWDNAEAVLQGNLCSANGNTVATGISWGGPIDDSLTLLGFNYDYSSYSQSWAGMMWLFCSWKTGFSQEVLNALTADPYQFLIPA